MIWCAALPMIGLEPGLLWGTKFDLSLYAVGWLAGWLLLWRLRPLPPAAADNARAPIAVVIPARDEATALTDLLPSLVAQLAPGDEVLVVDDHSADGTGDVAMALGARVETAPALPSDWLGKPHACWHGSLNTDAATLLFLDADVRPAPDLLDRVGAALADDPGAVVSVQPWHSTERPYEQTSILCNVAALMGSGAFTAFGSRVRTPVAFGPVVAIDRSTYDRAGGHVDPTTRRMHTEDIALARAVGRSHLYTGRPDTSFRMYPNGLGETVRGWTRSIATGARYTPWWLTVLVFIWIWSLAGGWLAAPGVYPLSAVQVWVLGRRAGSLHPVTALLYPLAVLGFVLIFLRSLVALLTNRQVAWKGRRVNPRTGD